MFDAEKLLGKVLSEFTGSHSKHKKKNKKKKSKKKHRSDDLVSGLTNTLMSGKGLLTAVGLGVGAYTILKGNQTSASGQQHIQPASPSPNPLPTAQASPPPPPPPPPISPQTGSSPAASINIVTPQENVTTKLESSPAKTTSGSPEEQELALRMIQVMIAAAHADGNLDLDEEKEILQKLRGANLENDEKAYILSQFHSPKSIAELTAGIQNPQICQAMYSLAVSSIVVDTELERQWLDNLARALNISKEMQSFIEE